MKLSRYLMIFLSNLKPLKNVPPLKKRQSPNVRPVAKKIENHGHVATIKVKPMKRQEITQRYPQIYPKAIKADPKRRPITISPAALNENGKNPAQRENRARADLNAPSTLRPHLRRQRHLLHGDNQVRVMKRQTISAAKATVMQAAAMMPRVILSPNQKTHALGVKAESALIILMTAHLTDNQNPAVTAKLVHLSNVSRAKIKTAAETLKRITRRRPAQDQTSLGLPVQDVGRLRTISAAKTRRKIVKAAVGHLPSVKARARNLRARANINLRANLITEIIIGLAAAGNHAAAHNSLRFAVKTASVSSQPALRSGECAIIFRVSLAHQALRWRPKR